MTPAARSVALHLALALAAALKVRRKRRRRYFLKPEEVQRRLDRQARQRKKT